MDDIKNEKYKNKCLIRMQFNWITNTNNQDSSNVPID